MSSTSGDLIGLALQRSFSPKFKKHKTSFDDHVVANACRLLSTNIDYDSTAKFSSTNFLDNLKERYLILNPSKLKKKNEKKKKKLKHFDSTGSPMKNTELSGQNLTLPTPKHVIFSPDSVQLGWKSSVPVGSGFVNLGTTCYINSTLQALFHVPSFVNWLLDDRKHHLACEKRNGIHHTECLVCAMSKTLIQSHRSTGSSLRPRLITEKIKSICKHLSPFRQEDAHEFLRYLIEAMEKSYTATSLIQIKKLDSYSKETTPLNQIFGGYIRTEVTCLECSQISTTFQHFQDLILDIRQAGTSTVYDALENYFSKERLDGDESYHCEHCKKKVSANKKFSIEKAPNALCIQLKRFNINSFYGGSKISKSISIPQTIDLSKFKHKKGSPNGVLLKYKLVSMVFHHGPSANSGHYTALGCTSFGSYYYFNDEQVSPTHLMSYSNTPNAYIIFYELEKPLIMPSLPAIKSSCCTITSVSNGYTNGTVQRNGFFTKRESSFTTSSNHSKQPSWELQNNYTPVKVNTVSTSTSTSATKPSTVLVPYMSSDSDSSDSENEKPDRNNNSQVEENGRSSALSPLAKRNSTLTSLLVSSPKNDNHAATPSKGSTLNGKSLRLEAFNGKDEKSTELRPEKRGTITFSFPSRDRKKDSVKENGDISKEDDVEKKPTVGIVAPYSGSRKNGDDTHKENGREENYNESNHCNGLSKPNVNGNGKVATNGWIITNVENECKINGDGSGDKMQNGLSAKGEWTITEKGRHSPLTKEYKNEIQENGAKKYINGNDEQKNEELERKDTSNGTSSHASYSSYKGYGGKVLTWNGDVSYINRESEKERRESSKRSYSQDYDDEMDRGKVKKMKYHNRNENNSNLPRKNLIQQYHNNFHRTKRQGWSNNNSHYGNNRRYNGYYKNNYNNYNRTPSYVHNNWRR